MPIGADTSARASVFLRVFFMTRAAFEGGTTPALMHLEQYHPSSSSRSPGSTPMLGDGEQAKGEGRCVEDGVRRELAAGKGRIGEDRGGWGRGG